MSVADSIIAGLNEATSLIKTVDSLVREFNRAKQELLEKGISYDVTIERNYNYLGLSPSEYNRDIIKGINERISLSVDTKILSITELPSSFNIEKNMIRNYDVTSITLGGKPYIIITGYRETETTRINVLLIPNIHYLSVQEQQGGGILPYTIIPLTSVNTLINIADDVFIYRVIEKIFSRGSDKGIATALFFTSHILGNNILKKHLTKIGVRGIDIKNILKAKYRFLMEYDKATSLTKNIFNIIASYGMVDWDLYAYINYVANANYGGELDEIAIDRIQSYINNVRSKMRIFLDGIKIISLQIKTRDGVAKSDDFNEIGIEIFATEQINPPFIVQDVHAGITNVFQLISPAPIMCAEPETDEYGFPLYDVLLKDGSVITVSELELDRYKFMGLTIKMKCKKEVVGIAFREREITKEYTNIISKYVKKSIMHGINLAPLSTIVNEGVSINAKIDFMKCISEISESHEGVKQIVIINAIDEVTD